MSDESTSRPASSLRIGSWFLVLLTISAIWVFYSFAVNQRLSTNKMSSDFGTEMPRFTKLALVVPDPVVIAGCALLSIILLFKEWWLRNKVTTLVINIVVLASCIVLYEIHREAMSLPLRELLKDLS